MLLLSCIVLQYLVLTSAYKKPGVGPPCYGRSDCTKALNENSPAAKETEFEYIGPKRYIRDDRFKSPIFGSYKFNPLMGEFEISNNSDTVVTASVTSRTPENEELSTVMRAFDPVDATIASTHLAGRRNDLNDIDSFNQNYEIK